MRSAGVGWGPESIQPDAGLDYEDSWNHSGPRRGYAGSEGLT